MFVPNLSFGTTIVRGLRECTVLFFDVHLMIVNPIKHVERFAGIGADGITVHAEACDDLEATIDEIRRCGAKAAVALSRIRILMWFFRFWTSYPWFWL